VTITEAVRRAQGMEMRMRVDLNAGEVVVSQNFRQTTCTWISAWARLPTWQTGMEQPRHPRTSGLDRCHRELVEGLCESSMGPVTSHGPDRFSGGYLNSSGPVPCRRRLRQRWRAVWTRSLVDSQTVKPSGSGP